MIKNIFIQYGIIILLLLCNGCKKAPINNNIEGHWQLIEFITKADKQIHPCDRIYYSIQLWVIEVAEKQGTQGLMPFRGRYQYNETTNSIQITEMSTYNTPQNSRPAETWELFPYGLNNTNTTLKVNQLNNGYMTLESDYAILKFKKF